MAKEKTPKKVYSMCNSLVNYYLLLMFTFFELFLTNQYAKARTDKFVLFIVLTCALIISVVSVLVAEQFSFSKDSEKVNISLDKPVISLSSTDIAFLVFFIGAVITTLISDYKRASLTGNLGRDNGLILIALYFALYIIVSRFYYYKSYVLVGFLVFGCIISGLAVLHFYYIDPLGLMQGYASNIIEDFGTTIGNKNTIASYMCIFLPFAMMMFIVQKNRAIKIISAVSIAFAYCGLIVAGSNSGYIGFFAMMFFMLVVCIRKLDMFADFMLATSLMLASGLILRFISFLLDGKSKKFEKIGESLIFGKAILVLIIVCLAVTAILYITKNSDNSENIKWPKNTLTTIVIALGVAAVGIFTYYFCYYTFVDTKSDIGALSQILRFDDRWGTHRGFMWINGVRDYLNFDFMHILFGSGCDTFYKVFEPHFAELSRRFHNSSTNSIHSEYLNYLITQGLVGLGAYLTIIGTTIVRALKTAKTNALALVFVLPVVAYCAQAVVNIYQPITTPLLIIFIALSECLSRQSNQLNKLT